MITLIGFAAVILFCVFGYKRGLFRILAAFGSFLLASVLAKPCSVLLLGLVGMSGQVPRTLVPLASQLLAGLLVFFLLSSLVGRILDNREEVREQLNEPHTVAAWEHIGGAVLGMAWGIFLVVFTLTGLHMIGTVEEVLVQSPATATGEPGAAPGTAGTFVNEMEVVQQESLPAAKLGELKEQIDSSAFGVLVRKVDPVDETVKEIFRNLTLVVSNQDLYERFRNHQVIARFTGDPRMVALAEDMEIQGQLRDRQYYQLLDNVKIAALLNDRDLYRQLKDVEIAAILQEIIDKDRRP